MIKNTHFLILYRLYIDLLIDSLSEYSYDAEIAGLSYYLSHESKGIEVNNMVPYLYTTKLKLVL
jgi:secreted Zn-dependent insulinase-like peptidase